MTKALISEVIKKIPRTTDYDPFKVNLNKNIDNTKNYNIHQNFTQNNTTINNNNIKKGFFRFLIDIIFLPIALPYKFFRFLYIKYDLKNKFEIERKKIKIQKLRKKYLKKTKSLYDLDEIF